MHICFTNTDCLTYKKKKTKKNNHKQIQATFIVLGPLKLLQLFSKRFLSKLRTIMTNQYIFEVQILFLNILKYQLVIKNVSNIKQRIPSLYQDQFQTLI